MLTNMELGRWAAVWRAGGGPGPVAVGGGLVVASVARPVPGILGHPAGWGPAGVSMACLSSCMAEGRV